MSKILDGKNALIYGGGGGIGRGVARTFARRSAGVLAGQTRESLDVVASDIAASGGSAEDAIVDALDESAVDKHIDDVVASAGSADVSFNTPLLLRGLEMIAPLMERALSTEREGEWKLVRTMANRMPTGPSYLRRWGDTEFRAFKFDVLRVESGGIAEITTFDALLPGLPTAADA